MATPSSIDGYDWDISEEQSSYPLRDRHDACKRAMQWRTSQRSPLMSHPARQYELVDPPVLGSHGWLHVGNNLEWDRSKLRIFWHPETDRVRMERPKLPPPPINVPKAPPVPPEPIKFSVNITTRYGTPDIWVRLRFLPSRGRENLAFPTVSLKLPPPPDVRRALWQWTTKLAESRFNVITLPEAFLTASPTERLPMYRQAIYDHLLKIGDERGRRT